MDFDRLTREFGEFMLNESADPDLMGYLQALTETLRAIRTTSRKDERRVQLGIQHLNEVKRHVKRMNKKITTLEEQVKVLEESKGD